MNQCISVLLFMKHFNISVKIWGRCLRIWWKYWATLFLLTFPFYCILTSECVFTTLSALFYTKFGWSEIALLTLEVHLLTLEVHCSLYEDIRRIQHDKKPFIQAYTYWCFVLKIITLTVFYYIWLYIIHFVYS